MNFIDLRKPNMPHLYYLYVYSVDGDNPLPSLLYRLGYSKPMVKELRLQNRCYDLVRVW